MKLVPTLCLMKVWKELVSILCEVRNMVIDEAEDDCRLQYHPEVIVTKEMHHELEQFPWYKGSYSFNLADATGPEQMTCWGRTRTPKQVAVSKILAVMTSLYVAAIFSASSASTTIVTALAVPSKVPFAIAEAVASFDSGVKLSEKMNLVFYVPDPIQNGLHYVVNRVPRDLFDFEEESSDNVADSYWCESNENRNDMPPVVVDANASLADVEEVNDNSDELNLIMMTHYGIGC
ncbi:hypothetical protein CTI12_AA270960 [Artemisia annua]|uniref:Uncharacterized protein n=1 Tax=Artemisia annua TaxID=35608 RepID=A0A2U1NFW1_ARTAN|nr:hypothetical protein CTI12_AA270960 [Artemisia annua]